MAIQRPVKNSKINHAIYCLLALCRQFHIHSKIAHRKQSFHQFWISTERRITIVFDWSLEILLLSALYCVLYCISNLNKNDEMMMMLIRAIYLSNLIIIRKFITKKIRNSQSGFRQSFSAIKADIFKLKQKINARKRLPVIIKQRNLSPSSKC